MVFSILQRELEKIYSLHPFPPVELFLITTEELSENHPHLLKRPQVLFHEKQGEAYLGVHLGDETVERAEQQGLGNLGLGDFCAVTEEISHFLYLSFCATLEKKVSLLDLEVQAEVDKFLLANRYFPDNDHLFEELFEEFCLHEGLDPEEKDRYQEANRLGAKMAKWMEQNYREQRLENRALEFLRNFYRMTSQNKLNKVEKMKGI